MKLCSCSPVLVPLYSELDPLQAREQASPSRGRASENEESGMSPVDVGHFEAPSPSAKPSELCMWEGDRAGDAMHRWMP